MPQGRIALVAFDLDGTLLRQASAGVLMARALGHEERMHYFEALRVRELFAAGREEMVEWYRTTTLEKLTAIFADATLAPGALEAFAILRTHGIKTALVSCTWEFAVAWFARYFGADYYVGTGLSADWQIRHFWSFNKPEWLEDLARRLALEPQQFAGVGDSHIDVPMLKWVGQPFFVGQRLLPEIAHAHHYPDGDIREIAQHIVRISQVEEVQSIS